MKRNSCTQTGTNVTGVYSKTGGEIVSASRVRGSTTKHVTVSVQTSLQEIPTLAIVESHARETKSANSQNPCAHYQNNVKCKDQSCQTHTIAQIMQCTCVSCDQNESDKPSTRLRNFQNDAQIVSQQTQTSYTSDTSTRDHAHRHVSSSNSGQQKQKEAKNQINTSKSKHNSNCTHSIYPSINDNKNGSSAETKRVSECCKRSLFTTCSLCSKQKPVTSNAAHNCNVCQKNSSYTHENISGDDQACVCVNTCKCDASDNDTDRRIIIGKPRQNLKVKTQNRCASSYNEQRDIEKVCDCANDCTACKNPQTIAKALRKCHSNAKIDNNGLCHFECRLKTAEHQSQAQAYSDSSQDSNIIKHRVQNSLQCNCDEACSCSNNQTKDTVKGRACKSYASKPNFTDDISINKTDKNCKHCRVCGAMYQNIRKCDCQSQTHPRAVAYELSFSKENISKNEMSDIQTMPKAPKQHLNAAKSDACNTCDIKKNNFIKNYRQTSSSSLQVSISVNFDAYSS